MIETPSPAQRRKILAALMMTMALAAVDTTVVSTAIPQIVGDLGGFTLFSWVFSAYLLAQTVTIPIYGKLADAIGRKPVLVTGTTIFLIGSLLSAVAWDMPSLIAFRALKGLGAGAIMATVNTLAGDLYSIRERAAVQGWLSSVWGVTAIVGPTLGGAFAQYASWRWIFLINLPIGAGALYLITRHLKETPDHSKPRIDYAGATCLLFAGAAVIFGLLQGGQSWPWWSLQSGLILLTALVFITATVLVERRAAEPIMPGWIWSRRLFVGPNLATVGMGIVMMGPSTYLPTFGQSVLHLGAIAAGLLLASSSIGWPLASSLSGRLYLRFGFRDTALLGAGLVVAAVAGFLYLPHPTPVWLVLLDQIILGAGFGFISTPLLVGVQATVTWRERGVVTGANIFSRNLGQSLGAAVAGALFNSSFTQSLKDMPAALSATLPGELDEIIKQLEGGLIKGPAGEFLQAAVFSATHEVYQGLGAFAVFIFSMILLAPRRFPVIDQPTNDPPPGPPAEAP